MEDLIERFIESESRTEADIQKRQSDIEIEKNKAQEIRVKMKVTLEIITKYRRFS